MCEQIPCVIQSDSPENIKIKSSFDVQLWIRFAISHLLIFETIIYPMLQILDEIVIRTHGITLLVNIIKKHTSCRNEMPAGKKGFVEMKKNIYMYSELIVQWGWQCNIISVDIVIDICRLLSLERFVQIRELSAVWHTGDMF